MYKKGLIIYLFIVTILLIAYIIKNITPDNKKTQNEITYQTTTTIQNTTTKETTYSLNHVPILMYHSVNNTPIGSPDLSLINKSFESQIKYLSENGYTPLFFDELQNKDNIKKPVIITFDDGYSDNYYNAYKILKKYNFKATYFITTGFIGGKNYLTKNQILEMTDFISFQSHTLGHPELNTLKIDELEKQLINSKSYLSELTGKPVYVLSYPNGNYNSKVIEIAKKNYTYAVTMNGGKYNKSDGNYKIRRIYIERKDTLNEFISKIT